LTTSLSTTTSPSTSFHSSPKQIKQHTGNNWWHAWSVPRPPHNRRAPSSPMPQHLQLGFTHSTTGTARRHSPLPVARASLEVPRRARASPARMHAARRRRDEPRLLVCTAGASVPTTVMSATDEDEHDASASWNVSAHSRSYPRPRSPTLTSAAFCLIPIQ
jgi:hypothetical protein